MSKRIWSALTVLTASLMLTTVGKAAGPALESTFTAAPDMEVEAISAPVPEIGGGTDEGPLPDIAAVYADVSEADWYYPALNWCEERELLRGIPLYGSFQSGVPVTRAMFTVMLVNLLEPNAVWAGDCVYSDVQPGAYYYGPVSWAGNAGMASGYGDGSFRPGGILTRQQAALLLEKAARSLGYDTAPASSARFMACTDAGTIEPYARDAVKWCLQTGILAGTSAKTIDPQGRLTRAQAVRMIQGFGTWMSGPDAVILENCVAPSAVIQDTEAHRAIQSEINKIAARYGADGLTAAYIRDGKVSDTFAYGSAVKGKTPMTADSKLRVASISKVLVGLAAHLSAEEGVMDLDADLGEYLGFSIRKARTGDKVTARSILTHTSSLTVAGDGVSSSYDSIRRRLTSSAATRNVVSGNPGNWAYNNYAFGVLGVAAERAGQRTLDELLHGYLYGPLSIDAAFCSGNITGKDQLAELYRADGSIGLSYQYLAENTGSGIPGTMGNCFPGGLTISAYDLGKIVALLASDGQYDGVQYLDPAVVSAMEQHGSSLVSGGFYQCQPLRYRTGAYGQSGLYYHTGSAYGVYNLISYNPATRCGVVVLTTGASGTKDGNGIYAVCGEAASLLYAQNP